MSAWSAARAAAYCGSRYRLVASCGSATRSYSSHFPRLLTSLNRVSRSPYWRWLVPFEISEKENVRPLEAASSVSSGFKLKLSLTWLTPATPATSRMVA